MTATTPAEPAATDEKAARHALAAVRAEVAKVVVGQDAAVTGLVIALLSGGTSCSKGCPASPRPCWSSRSRPRLELDFKRVQFTPDLMPGDVTGSLIFDARNATFTSGEGPVFTNLLLADEINRTPPKTQAVAARGHGGTPGVGRREVAAAARPVHRDRHPEPGRVRGHLPAARGPARPVPVQAPGARYPSATERDRGRSAGTAAGFDPHDLAGAGVRAVASRRTSRPPGARSPRSEVEPRGAGLHRRPRAGDPRPRRRCRSACHHAARTALLARRGRGPGCRAGRSSRPTTSRPSPTPTCVTASSCAPRSNSRASPPTACSTASSPPCPSPLRDRPWRSPVAPSPRLGVWSRCSWRRGWPSSWPGSACCWSWRTDLALAASVGRCPRHPSGSERRAADRVGDVRGHAGERRNPGPARRRARRVAALGRRHGEPPPGARPARREPADPDPPRSDPAR